MAAKKSGLGKLPRQRVVCLSSLGAAVVIIDGLAETGRLREPYAAGDGRDEGAPPLSEAGGGVGYGRIRRPQNNGGQEERTG